MENLQVEDNNLQVNNLEVILEDNNLQLILNKYNTKKNS